LKTCKRSRDSEVKEQKKRWNNKLWRKFKVKVTREKNRKLILSQKGEVR